MKRLGFIALAMMAVGTVMFTGCGASVGFSSGRMAKTGVPAEAPSVKLASPFTDNMVLQRGKPVTIWGKADPGEEVVVSFAGQKVKAVAGTDGKWRLQLAPMVASKEDRTLTAKGKRGAVEVRNVLVGEVWICSGQSNMELPLWGENPHFRDRQGAMVAQVTRVPWFRFVNASTYTWSVMPKDTMTMKWQEVNPQTLLNTPRGFSATGFYYGLELARALDVPVGMIDSRWGGTNIDAWTPREGLASVPELKEVLDFPVTEKFTDAMKKGPIHGAQQQPTVLYNANIAPYVPYTLRGAIWYQGEHNAGEGMFYTYKLHGLYNGLSKVFENPDFKLYIVQLAPWGFPQIATIQEAQQKFVAEEKNAGIAIINDIGNLRDIHPNEKELVAKRLALLALKHDYGFTDIVAESPTLASFKLENGKFALTFNNAKSFYLYNKSWDNASGFEVAGADGKFVPADLSDVDRNGRIKGQQLVVGAASVKEPKHLRYLYSSPWEGHIYNEVCLPIGAFHIDL